MSHCGHSDGGTCLREYTAKRIGAHERPNAPGKYARDCPVCGGPDKLSVQAGTDGAWIVWTCHRRKRGQPGWCDPAKIREHLLQLVSAQHLGGHARFAAEPARKLSRDEQLAEALGKLRAIEKAMRTDHAPADLRIQIGAVLWCGGKVPGDRSAYLALAEEAGIGRTQRYEAWARRGVVCDASRTTPAKDLSSRAGQRIAIRPETGRKGQPPSGNRTTQKPIVRKPDNGHIGQE